MAYVIRAQSKRMGMVVAASVIGLVGCGDSPGLSASFDYELSARFEVPARQAPEEQGEYEVYAKGPLHRDDWVVRFDACESRRAVEYRWTVEGESAGVTADCDGFEHAFPGEGVYSVSLVVADEAGEEESTTADVEVRDLLIFGVGDSYGSGEGNPDVEVVDDADAQWQNLRCHRSALSGQVLAAQQLEEADPHTSVTFVHLACSGGRVYEGLLDTYEGIVPDEDGGVAEPQIEVVAELADGHEIDALFVSIGGNDINFSDVVKACVLGEKCHEDDPVIDPVLSLAAGWVCGGLGAFEEACETYFDTDAIEPETLDARQIFDVHSTAQDVNGLDIMQDGIDDLPMNYRALDAKIEELLDVEPGRVFLAEIPDVTRDERGVTCGWPEGIPGLSDGLRAAIQEVPGITQTEMQWASDHVLTMLREAMRDSAAEHGWQFVDGVDPRFEGHGYCAAEPWLVRLQNTFQIQGDSNGALHPNVPGHEAYAAAILDTWAATQ